MTVSPRKDPQLCWHQGPVCKTLPGIHRREERATMGRMHLLAIRDPCVRHHKAHTERPMTGRMHLLAIRDPCVRHRQAHTKRAMTGQMHQASVAEPADHRQMFCWETSGQFFRGLEQFYLWNTPRIKALNPSIYVHPQI